MPLWGDSVRRQERQRAQRKRDQARAYRRSRRREWSERPVRTVLARLMGR